MSEPSTVHMISAYGRGETLALALQDNGFDVHILDFTQALGDRAHKGVGPFPVAATAYLNKQELLLSEAKPLPRGMAFWLNDGPLELGGLMADFFAKREEVVALRQGSRQSFDQDWLRRFMRIWTSPFQWESWQGQIPPVTFPYADNVGLIPALKEERQMSFERFRTLEHKYTVATELRDIQFEGNRITEVEIETGHGAALRGPQWIWCLSSEESEHLGEKVARAVFAQKIRRAEWRWICFEGRAARGSWTSGFPAYAVLIKDLHLPWSYANLMILRWTDSEAFRLWMKVPANAIDQADRRAGWSAEALANLNERLPQARWTLQTEDWTVCPHSPVYDLDAREESLPGWKNFDWIAPEGLARLDISARLEREAQSHHRLTQWRADQQKKQGASRDHALHAP